MSFLKRALQMGLLVLLHASVAIAAPFIDVEIPGDGIDNQQAFLGQESSCPVGYIPAKILGGCDRLKPSADADGDGFKRIPYCAGGECDPDDMDRAIYPGSGYTVKGCSGGQVRTPLGDGTFTACAAFTCPTGYTCKFFDTALGSNTTGDGSIANPWKDLGKVSYFHHSVTPPFTLYTYSTPHYFYLRGGTYTPNYDIAYGSHNWSCRQSTTGTVEYPTTISAFPGETVTIAPSNLFATGTNAFYSENCSNLAFRNMRISGGFGPGIHTEEGSNVQIHNIIATSPASNGDNHGCLYLHSNNDSLVQSSILYDCWKGIGANPNVDNNNNIFTFRQKNLTVRGTTSFYTTFIDSSAAGTPTGGCWFDKHANLDSAIVVRDFVMFNCTRTGIWYAGAGYDNQRVLGYNVLSAINYGDRGGPSFQQSPTGFMDVQDSTFISPPSRAVTFTWNPQKRWNPPIGDPPFQPDMCSATGQNIATIRFRRTITVSKASGTIFNNHTFGPDQLYDLSKISMSDNSWYNTSGPVAFSIHSSNNGNTTCSDVARGNLGQVYDASQWQAAGFDTGASGSVLDNNPVFDSYLRATGAGHVNHGWLKLSDEVGAGPTPTPTATPTPAPTPGVVSGLPHLYVKRD